MLWTMVKALDLDVKLYGIDKDKTRYQDQVQALWKSTICSLSIWIDILYSKPLN